MSERGLIVAFYGMNNIGKTTVIKEVEKKLAPPVQVLKYPIYESETGRRINRYLRGGNSEMLSIVEAQELFAENRVVHEPYLLQLAGNNRYVILEDYKETGYAWGTLNGISIARMERINKGQLNPDLGILLDGERFVDGVELQHLHEEVGDTVWNDGRRTFQILAKLYDWKTVNVVRGELPREIDEVTNFILQAEMDKEIKRRKVIKSL